jgi:hypothetical protein
LTIRYFKKIKNRIEKLEWLIERVSIDTEYDETFEKCSILFKFKEGENFNHRNTLSILRIKI